MSLFLNSESVLEIFSVRICQVVGFCRRISQALLGASSVVHEVIQRHGFALGKWKDRSIEE